jgi:indolepyruvate ferredoxin oxidoreductase
MGLRAVTLEDKYEQRTGTIYLTGSQALLRLAMNQIWRDEVAGLRTAAYITGYRGSPMHNIDKESWRAKKLLTDHRVVFHPAINEDLAATACWGTQQTSTYAGARYDGVSAIWYGKGPGLDRSIDAIRHANLAGTSRYGGVLAAVGDDPAMKSTDVPAASETMFADLNMPVLYPATVQEVLDFGIIGWAMSRFSGAWVGFKLTADTVDAAAAVDGDPERVNLVVPNFEVPHGGVHIRSGDTWLAQEPRLRRAKIPAAMAFARANAINRRIIDGPRRRYGIIAAGKAAMDTLQALEEMGIDKQHAADLGISVLKIGMPFPLDNEVVRTFADGLEEVFVIEEKRRLLEVGVKDALFDLPESRRPRVIGRMDEAGELLIPEIGEFGSEEVSRALAKRIARFHTSDAIKSRIGFLDRKAERGAARSGLSITRMPYFCSGCPHNTSTKVPEGSRAHGGVGCHFMSTYMGRNVTAHTHMGGEGATWIGQAPFTSTPHVFQNLGDGTYFHSGLLAIRACVAAGVNITYKILFNDAVAMTGGQPHDGAITPMSISAQVAAEGVKRIIVVTDDPGKYPSDAGFAKGTTIEPRHRLDYVQRQLRETKGVSILIYDQTCAAEKRRRRKKGEMVDPPRRMFINPRVCEGCGDCSKTSNCLSVLPLDTEFGRKRQIDQSSCNKDYSCAEGFCPSFVNVIGAKPKRATSGREVPRALSLLPEPKPAVIPDNGAYNVLITGIGGTGVVTIAALLTMGAHLEGKAFSTIDQFGMAQKGGAVMSHVRIADTDEALGPARLSTGSADLILGCDSLVTSGEAALSAIDPARTHLIVNSHKAITGQFALNPDLDFPAETIEQRILAEAGSGKIDLLNASRLATALMGDSIASNLFMLGYAYQKGLVPVSAPALMKAIELNGLAIESNKAAFDWGRRAAFNLSAVEALIEQPSMQHLESLNDIVAHRRADLVAYQDEAYARRYETMVRSVETAEAERAPGHTGLAFAVARNLYKLMAYKDEYEVARLYSEPAFRERLEAQFDNLDRIELNLAPPLLARRDRKSGQIRKMTFGPWIFPVLKRLAKLKRLRGSAWDIFGRTEERRTERALIGEYETHLGEVMRRLDARNHGTCVAIAEVPALIRGYGRVKAPTVAAARADWEKLVTALRSAQPVAAEAAE